MDHETADLSMPQAPEEELGLSAAALAALAEFALDNGILAEADADSSIRQQVQSHFEALEPEKEELFTFEYGHVRLTMEGWRRDLGQTLSSTGLTVWSGAEDLAAYLWRHRAVLFPEKSQKVVVELGAGLGLPGILCGAIMALASDSGTVICTDGDDNSLEKLRRNVEINGELLGAVQTEVLRLRWGQDLRVLDEALERLHGEDGRAVDLIIAADVIYQVRLSTCPTQLLDAPARCLHEGYGG
uniref:Calmodulin-lysine N-methyltransferase n=1 Tax=Pinguiococcus pyrenoidosus TaxID=172671 RepID=A0A7R9UAN4_9STRA